MVQQEDPLVSVHGVFGFLLGFNFVSFCVIIYFVKGTRCFSCVSYSVLSQEIDWEEHLQNDLFCVRWDENLNSIDQSINNGPVCPTMGLHNTLLFQRCTSSLHFRTSPNFSWNSLTLLKIQCQTFPSFKDQHSCSRHTSETVLLHSDYNTAPWKLQLYEIYLRLLRLPRHHFLCESLARMDHILAGAVLHGYYWCRTMQVWIKTCQFQRRCRRARLFAFKVIILDLLTDFCLQEWQNNRII